ncbi:hypothetical protein MMF93_00555 [Streptomyces tubbatahanensis]|uniref:Uncharacterized protein n=1 Tax=Streptomyces tubbatahanensis TaxID=2923272 RepID=A0ABY3XL16_9ACTN|nr:hypothetical protein [Streptomyces tubbatahanensis]UNS95116.1 hypothetical protein MMF93_00555 [Streptomyces tubbatahanensis]
MTHATGIVGRNAAPVPDEAGAVAGDLRRDGLVVMDDASGRLPDRVEIVGHLSGESASIRK